VSSVSLFPFFRCFPTEHIKAVEIHGFLSRKYGQPANLPSMSKL
jgi:hypothetical protein